MPSEIDRQSMELSVKASYVSCEIEILREQLGNSVLLQDKGMIIWTFSKKLAKMASDLEEMSDILEKWD